MLDTFGPGININVAIKNGSKRVKLSRASYINTLCIVKLVSFDVFCPGVFLGASTMIFYIYFLCNCFLYGKIMCLSEVVEVIQNLQHPVNPHWDATRNTLYFVDTNSSTVHLYHPETQTHNQTQIYPIGDPISFIIPVQNQGDSFLVAHGLQLCILYWDGSDSANVSVDVITTAYQKEKDFHFIGGKVDRHGQLYVASLGVSLQSQEDKPAPQKSDHSNLLRNITKVLFENNPLIDHLSNLPGLPSLGSQAPKNILRNIEKPNGVIYSYKPFGSLKVYLTGLGLVTGLGFEPNGSGLYITDSIKNTVDRFDKDVKSDFALSNQQNILNHNINDMDGKVYGLTVDTNGKLWIALYDGGQVLQFDPVNKEIMKKFDVPSLKVTDLVFGGADLNELYITTAGDCVAKGNNTSGSLLRMTGLGDVQGLAGRPWGLMESKCVQSGEDSLSPVGYYLLLVATALVSMQNIILCG